MPLPPAPAKRAALLSPDALDAPARPSAKAARASSARVESPQSGLDLFDDRLAGTAATAAKKSEIGRAHV